MHPRVVIGMMQRDEATRLEAWILYHARLFGFDALHIFDNGSVLPEVLEILRRYAARGVQVDYRHTGREGFHNKGFLVARLFQELEADARNRFFIPLDCDEFLILRRPSGELTAEPETIAAYFEPLLGDPHILVTPEAYANVLGRPGWFFKPYAHHKVFFTEGCVRGLAEGFHRAQSRKLNAERETDFAHLHFHYRPFAEMVLHSRHKLAAYTDVSNPEALACYAGTASHVKRFLNLSQSEYTASFTTAEVIEVPWFLPLCREIGIPPGFIVAI